MPRIRPLLLIGELPILQNRVYATRDEARAAPMGSVELVEDLETGLVYNAAFDEMQMVYDENYQNEQAHSTVFRRHLDEVADLVERQLGRADLVEVGCGKGTFLELLSGRGAEIRGFDPSYEGANPRVSRTAFRPGVEVRARGLILRHVLEHVFDPVVFLKGLRDANGGEGLIYIEVPCFDWILERRAWFDVFYEHVNYFRLADFERMFDDVRDSGRLFGGQYIYVIASLASLRRPIYDPADPVTVPTGLLDGVLRAGDHASTGLVWGGSSKGVIFSLLRARHGLPVMGVVDINPAKQGRYLPATGLKVMTPEEALAATPPGTVIYVMNSNYLGEIQSMSNGAYRYVCVDQ